MQVKYRVSSVTPQPGTTGGEVRAVYHETPEAKKIFGEGTAPTGLVFYISDPEEFKKYQRGGMITAEYGYEPSKADEAVAKAEAESKKKSK